MSVNIMTPQGLKKVAGNVPAEELETIRQTVQEAKEEVGGG